MNNNYQDEFNDTECTTIIDTLFPYLFITCFLLGVSFNQIKKFLGSNFQGNSLDHNKKSETLSNEKYEKISIEKF